MRIITIGAIKGGVGKTTITYHYAEKLARMDKKVLLIDLDHQCNLTQMYGTQFTEDGTVGSIFRRQNDVKIHHVANNIDLIAGDLNLDVYERELETKVDKDLRLFEWLTTNLERYDLEQYEFVLIDTHPDFSIATRNAILVSHAVVSPITPSEFGENARYNLEARLDSFRDETKFLVINATAELLFVGNMVKHNTNISHDFMARVQNDDTVIGVIPYREQFNKSSKEKMSVFEMADDPTEYVRNKRFYDSINEEFERMIARLEMVG